MNAITYSMIVDAVFDLKNLAPSDPAAAKYLLLSRQARKLDYLRETLQLGAVEMARKFAAYANEFEGTLRVSTPPTGWSTLTEMTKGEAEFNALAPAFEDAFELLTGQTLYKAKLALEDAAEVRAADVAVAAGEVRS
jgi:hypothetical protein